MFKIVQADASKWPTTTVSIKSTVALTSFLGSTGRDSLPVQI